MKIPKEELSGLKFHECSQEDRILRVENQMISLLQRVTSIEAKILVASALGGVVSTLVFRLLGGATG
jgi:diaminopimelate decarboxylase